VTLHNASKRGGEEMEKLPKCTAYEYMYQSLVAEISFSLIRVSAFRVVVITMAGNSL
jgi:hypothetical protein